MKYIKQLDSLRAIAVILVIISHWFSETHILNHLPNGKIGVDMFFVLSGFLITSILFQNRNNLNASKGEILRTFYARRTLRIFPIYYLTIFILLVFHKYTGTNIKHDFIYYLTYTSNLNFLLHGHWDGILSHLWSLAVEEQFYLIWPWFIIFTKKKYLFSLISMFILIGVSSHIIMSDFPWGAILTTSCFDSFGVGAMLSWFIFYNKSALNKFYTLVKTLSLILIALIIFGNLVLSKNYWTILPLRTANSIISIWLITYIYLNRDSNKGVFRFFLSSPILIFVGKISYGIYLYHNIIPQFSTILIESHLIKSSELLQWFFKLPYSTLSFNSILVILISWGSFKIIETPFLKLKKKFVPNKKESNTG
ncbi:acyltransferase family protein [Xanthovirga aplysinae]|uniref:acyltransferase family protein n=1 Tax=Xanthovirga aplysinae TaxID=2529853 RepID=UPI0012BCA88E|nr:acyltransferase [Xanthovirga aplysinae]